MANTNKWVQVIATEVVRRARVETCDIQRSAQVPAVNARSKRIAVNKFDREVDITFIFNRYPFWHREGIRGEE